MSTTPSPFTGAPSPPPQADLQQVLHAHLRHPSIALFPQTPLPMIRRATAYTNRGLDHIGNESLVAIAHEKIEDMRGNAIVLTDRRLFGVSGPNLFSVPYAAISGLSRRTEMFDPIVRIVTGSGGLDIAGTIVTSLIEPLVHALAQMPEELRIVERAPLAVASNDDPIGAAQIKSKLLWPDAHLQAAVGFVEQAHRLGWIDAETSLATLKRILLLNRTAMMGRGFDGGWWISPVLPHDLAHGFVSIFGPPRWQGADGEAMLFDFHDVGRRFPDARDDVLSLRAAVRQSVDRMRVTITPNGTLASAFKTESMIGLSDDLRSPVAIDNARLFQAFDETLLGYETQVTLFRTVLGWQLHPAELLAHGAQLAPQRIFEAQQASAPSA